MINPLGTYGEGKPDTFNELADIKHFIHVQVKEGNADQLERCIDGTIPFKELLLMGEVTHKTLSNFLKTARALALSNQDLRSMLNLERQPDVRPVVAEVSEKRVCDFYLAYFTVRFKRVKVMNLTRDRIYETIKKTRIKPKVGIEALGFELAVEKYLNMRAKEFNTGLPVPL